MTFSMHCNAIFLSFVVWMLSVLPNWRMFLTKAQFKKKHAQPNVSLQKSIIY